MTIKYIGILVMLFQSITLFGQITTDEPVEFTREKGTIKYFLNEIEKAKDIQFLYDNAKIEVDRQITLSGKTMTLNAFLEKAFPQGTVTYIVRGKSIILKPKQSAKSTQQKVTIKGYINDEGSGENLIGAHVYHVDDQEGVASNYYGFYSLTIPAGKASVLYSYSGYQDQLYHFDLRQDTTINIHLEPMQLEEVVVSADKPDPIQEVSAMGTVSLSSQQIKSRPVLAGEVDVIKALQLLPGVQSGHEGSAGLYVRGGGPDQNLILLDGVPVYNVSHLFGFMSVFNADAIQNVKLVKGAFPARYGGRLSSVVEISMKEGNNQEFHGEGAVGLVASKLTLEGPIAKGKTSFMISGRRTYIDLLARPFIKEKQVMSLNGGTRTEKPDGGYYFYDVNAKINHRFSDKDRIYFSAYSGLDKGYGNFETEESNGTDTEISQSDSDLRWGSKIALLRWNHVISKKLFSNLSVSYSAYNFFAQNKYTETATRGTETIEDFQRFRTSSEIDDWSVKLDMDYFPSPNHAVRMGISFIDHVFSPNVVAIRSDKESDVTFNQQNIKAKEFAAYAEDDIRVSKRLQVNAGFHVSGFDVDDKLYVSFQPRLSGRYLLNDQMAIKGSYTHMTQFLNLLTNPGIGLPTDFWVPSTRSVSPQESDQYSLGWAYTHPVHEFEASVETYYKSMENLIEYKEGAGFLKLNENWQDKVTSGKGESYGIEFFVRKKMGNTDGWIGYTLSWANRQFEDLNNGQSFPYKFDRRHDISAVLDHQLTDKIRISGNWVYGTGTALTLPQAEYLGYFDHSSLDQSSYRFLQHYDTRNAYRMRAYHRMDLSVSFSKKKKWGEREWVVSCYNLYSRRNPFYIEQRATEDYTNESRQERFRELTLFPIIPSVSYRFRF